MKSRENILKAKLEILDGMNDEGILVINNDNDMLHNWNLNNDRNVVTFGIENNSDYMANNIVSDAYSSSYNVLLDNKDYTFKINIPGSHFVLNGLCALSIGRIFDINVSDISEGIENFVLTKRRMQVETINGITIVNDCYNANLDSMTGAINYLGSLKNTRKIAVLGDMLELGTYSEELHRKVGNVLFNNKIDIVITVGNASKYIKDELIKLGKENNIYSYDSNKEALNKLKEIVCENDTILIKSSLGMNFIEVYNGLKEIIIK